jgi:glycosyltransferase involved in cell wall biosynthesis
MSSALSVAALTGGANVPSARFRVRQYVSELARLGVRLEELISPFGSYPPERKWLRPLWGAGALVGGLSRVARSWAYDVCLLQRELVSTLVTVEPLTKRPRILDVDDAVFVYRGGWSARVLAQSCDKVICGNAFLAEWYRTWNRDIEILPTPVDVGRFRPKTKDDDGEVVIGWIGVSRNLRYVAAIESALRHVLTTSGRVRLRIVSDQAPQLPSLPRNQVDFAAWSAESEVEQLQRMDIGIMPLADSVWERGKCSFKMLQYMACGLPVVVSPVGMNAEVLALGQCGFGATCEREWVDALQAQIESSALRKKLGAEGRRLAETRFSTRVLAPRLAQILLGR